MHILHIRDGCLSHTRRIPTNNKKRKKGEAAGTPAPAAEKLKAPPTAQVSCIHTV